MYLDKTIIEPALYQLVDEFNKGKVTHNQFCNIFLDLNILLDTEIGEHVKFCLFKTTSNL